MEPAYICPHCRTEIGRAVLCGGCGREYRSGDPRYFMDEDGYVRSGRPKIAEPAERAIKCGLCGSVFANESDARLHADIQHILSRFEDNIAALTAVSLEDEIRTRTSPPRYEGFEVSE